MLALALFFLQEGHGCSVTSAAAERNWSAWGRTYTDQRSNLSIATAEKLVYVKANMPASWLSE